MSDLPQKTEVLVPVEEGILDKRTREAHLDSQTGTEIQAIRNQLSSLAPGKLFAGKIDQILAEKILSDLRTLVASINQRGQLAVIEQAEIIQDFREHIAPVLKGYHQQLSERKERYVAFQGLKIGAYYSGALKALMLLALRFPSLSLEILNLVLLLSPLWLAWLLYQNPRGRDYNEKERFFGEFEKQYKALERLFHQEDPYR